MSEPTYFPVNLYLQKMVVIGFANSWLRYMRRKGKKGRSKTEGNI
jgi:hypothetical protein